MSDPAGEVQSGLDRPRIAGILAAIHRRYAVRVLACLICLLPSLAMADAIPVTSRLTDVTIFSGGAKLTREVVVESPAGPQELVIAGLPDLSELSGSLRLEPSDGLVVGAFSVSVESGAKPPLSGAQQAAEDRVAALEAEERQMQGRIDEIKARLAAGDATTGFLRSLGSGQVDLGGASADSLKAIAEMAGAGVLAAGQQAVAAKDELRGTEADLAKVQARLESARTARDDLATPGASVFQLRVNVTKASDAPAVLRISSINDNASWQPVYDADLDRKAGTLVLSRGLLVAQSTGEDWQGVHLTLSTADLYGRTEAGRLWADLRRIEPEPPPAKEGDDTGDEGGNWEPVVEPEVVVADTGIVLATPTLVGDTVIYDYPAPVTLASNSDVVQLPMDVQRFAPEIIALAVPRRDDTAFLQATLTNATKDILLPGDVNLLTNGALIGTGRLPELAPGAKADLGFGPIRGLVLKRITPSRSEGETGILTSANRQVEQAVITVENRTEESWPVRLLDRVPYSEQDDLKIAWTAEPPPSETDVDGYRGVLAWQFDLAPGATQEIRLDQVLDWPTGQVLR